MILWGSLCIPDLALPGRVTPAFSVELLPQPLSWTDVIAGQLFCHLPTLFWGLSSCQNVTFLPSFSPKHPEAGSLMVE